MVDRRIDTMWVKSSEPLEASFSPKTLLMILVVISLALTLISFVGVVILDPYIGNPYTGDPLATPTSLSKIVLRFDVMHEGNIPSWFSGILLFFSAVLLGLIARAKHRQKDRMRWHWSALSLMFVAFSLDEVAYLHEGLNNFMRESEISALAIGWVVPAAVLVFCVGVAYIPFLRHLPATTRRWFVSAAVLFLGGALALEIVDNFLLDSFDVQSRVMLISNHIQDLLEMLGVSLFIYALMDYIRSHMQPLRLVMS